MKIRDTCDDDDDDDDDMMKGFSKITSHCEILNFRIYKDYILKMIWFLCLMAYQPL